MFVSPSWFSLSCFVFPLLVVGCRFSVCACPSLRVPLWCLHGGLWAEALVVQKSDSGGVLAEGKPESCGKTLTAPTTAASLSLGRCCASLLGCGRPSPMTIVHMRTGPETEMPVFLSLISGTFNFSSVIFALKDLPVTSENNIYK